MSRTPQPTTAPPDLWDPVIRITHWGLAVVVLANAILTGGGSVIHVWLGWTGMALLVLRLVWGVLGPAEARFSAFPPNPRAAVAHLAALVSGRRVSPHGSHNPAGALMVYVFWASLVVIVITGLYMTGGQTPMQAARDNAAVASGDWSVLVTKDAEDGADTDATSLKHLAEEVHGVTANLLLFLAALHVAGVAVESRAMRRNLLAPMLLGLRRAGRRK